MLQRLFQQIGFSWSVRATGLVSGVGCGISVLTVTANVFAGQKSKGSSSFGGPIYKDGCFILLAAGSFFVALGDFESFERKNLFLIGARSLHPILLHCGLRP